MSSLAGGEKFVTHSVTQVLKQLDSILQAGLPAGVAPLAALDADGTIWAGDLGEEAFRRGYDAGLIQERLVDGALREWASDWGIAFEGDAPTWFSQLAARCCADRILASAPSAWTEHRARKDLYAMQAWAYAGATPDDLRAYGAQLFRETYRQNIFSWWPKLLAELRAREISVVVVSGTHPDLLVPCVQTLGISADDVFGSRPELDDFGRYQRSPHCALYGEKKAQQVERICQARFQARAPLLAFGDSVENTDRQMLEMATLPVAVEPAGKHFEGACRRSYWVIRGQVDG